MYLRYRERIWNGFATDLKRRQNGFEADFGLSFDICLILGVINSRDFIL